MKKTRMFLSAILAVIIALSLTTIAFASIESVDAKQIALTHAGLSESEVIGMKVKTDYDDGIKIFEIEFHNGNMEYEYEVNAANGKIISADKEYDDDYVVPTSAPSTTKPAQTENYITKEQAKAIALAHAGITESEAIRLTAKIDTENGISVYEVDFDSEKYEYDYDINAVTGKIISADKEYDDDYVVPTSEPSTTAPAQTEIYITTEQAKAIALAHAGITEAEAIRLTVKIDTENGIKVYEVDFDSEKHEYDYDINAVTGKIISADKEYDDDYRAPTSVTETPQTAVNAAVAPQNLSDTSVQEKINVFFEKLVDLFIEIFS